MQFSCAVALKMSSVSDIVTHRRRYVRSYCGCAELNSMSWFNAHPLQWPRYRLSRLDLVLFGPVLRLRTPPVSVRIPVVVANTLPGSTVVHALCGTPLRVWWSLEDYAGRVIFPKPVHRLILTTCALDTSADAVVAYTSSPEMTSK